MRIFNYLLGRIMLATFMCVACLETYAQLDYKMAGLTQLWLVMESLEPQRQAASVT